ncbi:MAG TPA: acetyltransferase [Allosphingosinicella sp.]|jgi:putative acetyltransferase
MGPPAWTIRRSRPDERERLHDIWAGAVRATHGFLAEEDFHFYSALVRDEMLPAGSFWVAADGDDRAVAWMDLQGDKLEALFVDPACHRRGAGKALMAHAARLSPVIELHANEQSGAVEYYRRLGFEEVSRSEVDGAGRPYPLVTMRKG